VKRVTFTERMSGYISFCERDYNEALIDGERQRNRFKQTLTIRIADIDDFLKDEMHSAAISGSVKCPELGGTMKVTRGWFNLLVPVSGDTERRRMQYRIFFADKDGRKLTMSGFKDIWHTRGLDGWSDTSHLLMRIFAGHHREDPADDRFTVATGILHINLPNFTRLLLSMLWHGRVTGTLSAMRFDAFFASQLAKLYIRREAHLSDENWPTADERDPRWQGYPPGEWHRLERPNGRCLERRIVGFQARDGRPGTLHQIRGDRPPRRGPVMLVHGCSVRANMFYGAPTEQTLVEALIDAGYDVWLENWRASIDLPPRRWTLDEGGAYDHPAAVEAILHHTGKDTLKAVVHCQGSTSFMMSVLGGLVPQVTAVVSNAVSLHIRLTSFSKFRMNLMTPLASPIVNGADPQWAVRAPRFIEAGFSRFAGKRPICDSHVCRAANFFYGAGPEVLWRHANLDDQTHTWNNREWGFCPTSFFKQMSRCANAGHILPVSGLDELPASFLGAELKPTIPRFTFIAGSQNTCFLPASQQLTWEYFERNQPGRHRFHRLPGYAHLDVFIGREAHRNVYPLIVQSLT